MQITLKELLESEGSLSKLLTLPLPIKTSYRLTKLTKKVNSELRDFKEKRNELILKHGEKDEKGRASVKADSPQMVEFAKEMNDLIGLDINLDCDRVSINMTDDLKLSAVDLVALEKFVDFKELEVVK